MLWMIVNYRILGIWGNDLHGNVVGWQAITSWNVWIEGGYVPVEGFIS